MSKNPSAKNNAYRLPDFTPAQMEEMGKFELACIEIEETLSDKEYSFGFDVLATIVCDLISGDADGPVKQTAELERFSETVEALLLKTRESEKYFDEMERKIER